MAYFIPGWGDDPYDPGNCPPTGWESWEWVGGECTGNAQVYALCDGWERPEIPLAWYHDDLLGVLRYWRQF